MGSESLDKPRAAGFPSRAVDAQALYRRTDLILLRPDATRTEVERWCAAALAQQPLALCVPGCRVESVVETVGESGVKVSALVGFPFGATDTDVKRFEIETALEAGAGELDCVMNLGWIREANSRAVLRELRDLREAAEERPVKAILEVSLLTPEQVIWAAHCVREAEVQFLVTATGCAGRPTTVDEVRAIREAVGPELGIKAVGGLGDPTVATALLAAGANRLGAFETDVWTRERS